MGAGIAWGVFSLLFSLLFSPSGGNDPADWFVLGINFLETGAFLIASLLCFRNWRSPQIVSGRTVWFWIGLGLMMYVLGNVFFFLWGNVWGLDPAVSFGDFFYILSYVFLSVGMFQAVLPRRLNLELSQWLIVLGIGLAGILLSIFVKVQSVEAAFLPPTSPPSPAAYLIAQAPPADGVAPDIPAPVTAPEPVASPAEAPSSAPGWALQIDNLLRPFEGLVGFLYLFGDIVLLIIAGTLLVAFWGGRFSQSWKLIAVAAVFLYLADMFFLYANNTNTYVEGVVWEVFWTLSAVFFWLGAVVEHAVSVNSRRSSRRRRG